MQLYMYISIAVVLLSTVVLLIIFQRNRLKDLRYRIGLVLSAIVSSAGSLLFPGLVTVFSANPALRFFIVFFLSILIYILFLFIVLILVFQIVSKEKMDNLIQKWEEKKLERKNARELKLHRKKAQVSKADAGFISEQEQTADAGFISEQEQAANAGFISEPEQTADAGFISEQEQTADAILNSQPADEGTALAVPLQQGSAKPAIEQPYGDASIKPEMQSSGETAKTPEPQPASEQPSELSSADQSDGTIRSDTAGKEKKGTDPCFSPVDLQDNLESSEKIVDTSDIIDKMGIDAVTDSAHPVPAQLGNSLTEIIKKAFLLKQQGNVMEAAVLYMTALDQKPDNETAFWIVLDICAIYKTMGHADLAEDILLTYIDAFEHLMSEEVKDQILQSLYEG